MTDEAPPPGAEHKGHQRPWPGPGSRPPPALAAEVACLLEVAARKPGNVTPERAFADATALDFQLAAAALGRSLGGAAQKGIGQAALDAVSAGRRLTPANANLGLVLLLTPLVATAETIPGKVTRARVARILARLTADDAALVFKAIRLAAPGGIGEAEEEDVFAGKPTRPLVEVMALAAPWDLVARQYSGGFREVFEEGAPWIGAALEDGLPLETAIVLCHLRFLEQHPDSLIWRKCGEAAARDASRRAGEVLRLGWPKHAAATEAFDALDAWLRADGHRRNPGTSADLVGASLFVAIHNEIIPLPLSGFAAKTPR